MADPTRPSLTPAQALARLREQDPTTVDGHMYILDGPMGCPREAMYPISPVEGGCWYPAGDFDDEITETTEWFYNPD